MKLRGDRARLKQDLAGGDGATKSFKNMEKLNNEGKNIPYQAISVNGSKGKNDGTIGGEGSSILRLIQGGLNLALLDFFNFKSA